MRASKRRNGRSVRDTAATPQIDQRTRSSKAKNKQELSAKLKEKPKTTAAAHGTETTHGANAKSLEPTTASTKSSITYRAVPDERAAVRAEGTTTSDVSHAALERAKQAH